MARSGLHQGAIDPRHHGKVDAWEVVTLMDRAAGASWDLETDGLDPRSGGDILCLSITLWDGSGIIGTFTITGTDIQLMASYQYWPKDTAAHNGKYDQLWCLEKYGVCPPVTWDTMLAEHLIDPEGPKGLKVLGAKYLGVPDWSVDVGKASALPKEALYKYAAMDTAVTAEIRRRQRCDERLLNDLLMPASKALISVEHSGVGLDRQGAKSLKVDLMKRADEITKEVSVYGPCKTPREISTLLHDTLDLPVLERTDTGRPRVTGSILKRLNNPVAAMLAERQKIQKGVSAFLNPWLAATEGLEDPRLYSTFRLAGTATGRLSSGGAEGASGINLQQIPRDKRFKRLIVAREGYTLAELDYSQIELRVAAHLAGEPTMLEIYRTGGDIHTRTAQAVTGRDNVTKEDRTRAKAVNFGFLYGMGAASFKNYARDGYGVHLTDEEASDYRRKFFELYSALPEWHKRTKEAAVKNGYVETLFGRRRYLDGLKHGSGPERGAALRQAVNTSVQGVASDMMLLALGLIHRLIVCGLYDAKIVATVHDSALLEIAEDEAEVVARKAKYIMEHLPLSHFKVKLSVPIEAGLSMGPRWGEMEEL
jgi:DNA polymerase-1